MFNTLKNGEVKKIGNRTIVNLNGTWQIGESVGADEIATAFDHVAPVPGLLTTAEPAFKDIGAFESRTLQYAKKNWVQCTGGVVSLPVDEEALNSYYGRSLQERNYFWCKRTFVAPDAHQRAELVVLKARFGSKVWLNGKEVGSNDSSFVSARYDVTGQINWGGENELIIRIGAHLGVMPEGILNMEDHEHEKWYPGIWDDVELYCYNTAAVRSVQFAPKIDPKEVLIETEVENLADQAAEITVTHVIKTQDMSAVVAEAKETYLLQPGAVKAVQCTVPMPADAKLWSTESPNLYVVETSTDGDTELNRFGLREVCFRSDTKRFYLNREICFLRGGMIMLGRFMEDPLCKQLPWTEKWVRRLIRGGMDEMHWNAAKYSLADVPRKWLEIADEEGLLGYPELPIWIFNPKHPEFFHGYVRTFNMEWLMRDVAQWVRDQRNHASLFCWCAALESCAEFIGKDLIPLGRSLDLEKRAWINSYDVPGGEDDPLEDHPYRFTTNGLPEEWGVPGFDMLQLESEVGHLRHSSIGSPGVPTGHALMISEYEWLWLTRGGEVSRYLANTYHKLPYPTDTPMERQETCNYLLAGMTEYWRAHRNICSLIFHCWLAGDTGPGHCAVCDYYKDPTTLEFQPAFKKYVRESFKPLGVYLEFWKREVQAGENRVFYVMTVNDYLERKEGEIILTMEYDDGEVIELGRRPFAMGPNGSYTVKYDILMPEKCGKATMKATAVTEDGLMTTSYRWVEVKTEIPPRPYGQF